MPGRNRKMNRKHSKRVSRKRLGKSVRTKRSKRTKRRTKRTRRRMKGGSYQFTAVEPARQELHESLKKLGNNEDVIMRRLKKRFKDPSKVDPWITLLKNYGNEENRPDLSQEILEQLDADALQTVIIDIFNQFKAQENELRERQNHRSMMEQRTANRSSKKKERQSVRALPSELYSTTRNITGSTVRNRLVGSEREVYPISEEEEAGGDYE